MNAVTDVQDWQTLAQQLDYDPIHQQELRACGQNQEHCRKEMLTTWAKKDQRASWKKLAESLDRMEHQQAAQRIREDFIPTIYNQGIALPLCVKVKKAIACKIEYFHLQKESHQILYFNWFVEYMNYLSE